MEENNNKLTSKLFTGTLVLNWKNNQMKVIKKRPQSLNPFEIPVKINIKVNVPILPEITAKGEVDIPAYKVKEMLIESI